MHADGHPRFAAICASVMVSVFQLDTIDAFAAPAPFESGGRRCKAAEAQLVGNFFPQSNVVEFQSSLHFYAWDNDAGRVFLKYDGRDVQKVTGQNLESLEYLDDFIVYKNDLYFSAKHEQYGRDLWRFDGSSARIVVDMEPPSFAPSMPIVYKDVLYFRGMGPEHLALFKYQDGAISMVEGIDYPDAKAVLQEKLLVHGHRREESGLFRVDGAAASFLFPMAKMGAPVSLGSDETMYFIGTHDPDIFRSHGPLWKVGAHGPEQVGRGLASFYGHLITYKSSLYYRGMRGELFRYDGVRETVVEDSGTGTDDPIVFQDRLYFMGSNREHLSALLSYDGSVVTSVLADTSGFNDNPRPYGFTVFNDELYFAAWQKTDRVGFWRMGCRK